MGSSFQEYLDGVELMISALRLRSCAFFLQECIELYLVRVAVINNPLIINYVMLINYKDFIILGLVRSEIEQSK